MPSDSFAPNGKSGTTLAIATGFDLSLALFRDAEVLADRQLPLVKGHAEALVPEIAALMAPFDAPSLRPSRIIVETGPGSFTGLRIGIAAARALGLAWDAHVDGVGSALLVAAEARARMHTHGAPADIVALVALSAPRGQIWVEPVALSSLKSQASPLALSPSQAADMAATFPLVIGSAAAQLASSGTTGPETTPRACFAANVPQALLTTPLPLYVRAPDKF